MNKKNRSILSRVGIAAVAVVGMTSFSLPRITADEPADKTPEQSHVHQTQTTRLIGSEEFGLPKPGMVVEAGNTAIVITDPQNDFLSPDGAAWSVVGESVTENGTVDNLETLFRTAHALKVPVFVSPHYYYPHDHHWHFEGALEHLMHDIKMFDRAGQLRTENFVGSGADWLERYKPYISADNVIVTSPHKVYGPESNDLVLQLRKRGIDKVILGGMSANLCTESHMRELIEQGFEVTVVKDATAGAKTAAGDAHAVAVSNFHYIASAVVTTRQAVASLHAAFSDQQDQAEE